MKKLGATIIAMAMMLGGVAYAVTDYSSYSTEELSRIRGTLQSASPEERDAFRKEWQSRMQQMSPEERIRYAGRKMGAGKMGQGRMQRKGFGRGGM
jgi:uncharacterized protein (DUF2236 family)